MIPPVMILSYTKTWISRVDSGDEITKKITTSEDVQFYWFLLSSDLEDSEEASKELLCMIIDLWITIRGFFFTKSLLEQYKQLHSLNTSKAKALHKVIS